MRVQRKVKVVNYKGLMITITLIVAVDIRPDNVSDLIYFVILGVKGDRSNIRTEEVKEDDDGNLE